jgi:hypothetical protein
MTLELLKNSNSGAELRVETDAAGRRGELGSGVELQVEDKRLEKGNRSAHTCSQLAKVIGIRRGSRRGTESGADAGGRC